MPVIGGERELGSYRRCRRSGWRDRLIATLTYLAVQIRQNTKAIRGATLDSITEHQQFELRWSSDIGTSFRKSIEAPGELTDQETWEVTEWMTSAFVARQNEFKQFKQGLLDEDNWAACEKIIYMCLGSAWAQNWWKEFSAIAFPDDFVSHVNRLLAEKTLDYAGVLKKLDVGNEPDDA